MLLAPVDELRNYSARGILTDGSSILIRALSPNDRQLLREHFARLSPESVYFRFMAPKKTLSEDDLDRFTNLDYVRRFGLAASRRYRGEERIIGVGIYAADSKTARPESAEVAFTVEDQYQGRGVGTLLLEHLCRIAHVNGINRLEADVMAGNARMLDVFARSGFNVSRSVEHGVVRVWFTNEETEQFLTHSLRRERLAAAQSIWRLLHPRSVAVIGASRERGKIGGAILANLLAAGFNGPIYPINPQAGEVQGLRSFPNMAAVGAPVDLAVLCVPAPIVENTIKECAAAGVHGVVVITAGFSEAGGRAVQDRITTLVRSCGMRMVGPNCMGIINTDPAVNLNATFAPVMPRAGNIGMLSQSGALGIAVLDEARVRNIGLSSFVSAGNKADVSGNDMLCYWADDPRTKAIVLYLESFGNPRKFARLAPAIARQKPIVAVKSGRSAAGHRAAMSHSAALANLDVAVEALFEQTGVIRTDTLEELFDVVSLLSMQPLPAGPRVGVVTNAGGPGILLADACEARGLQLPELEEETLAQLRSFLPERAGFSNPVDMTAQASGEDFTRTIAAVGRDRNVDAIVAIYIPPMVTEPAQIARGIAGGAAQVPEHKPVACAFMSSAPVPAEINSGPRGAIPCYKFPENVAIALEAAYRYCRWRKRPRGATLSLGDAAEAAIRSVVDRVLSETSGPVWLPPRDLARVLQAAGITLVSGELTTVEDAIAAAERIGYPLVAKIVSPDVVHKSDVGGVIMGLHSAADLQNALAQLKQRMDKLGKRLDGVLLQREISRGIEALVGVTTDPTFGPLLVCGLGGVTVELVKDVAFRLHPVTDLDAAEMVAALRSSALLDGYRGAPAGDREALIAVIRRISALVEVVPEITELDLNPVKVLAPGQGAIVIDARMRIAPARLLS